MDEKKLTCCSVSNGFDSSDLVIELIKMPYHEFLRKGWTVLYNVKGTANIMWILPFCHTASVVVVPQQVLCNLLFEVKISLYLPPLPPFSWQNSDGQSHALVVLIKTVRLTVGISVQCSDSQCRAAKSSFLPCWLITEIISQSERWIWELEPGSSDYQK